MGSSQKRKDPTQIGLNFIGGLPLLFVIKKHGNNFGALHFLKTLFKRPNKQNPYEKFSRACLWEWFTIGSELKPNYKHAMEVGTTMKSNKESMHALEDYPKVCDSFIVML